MSDFRKIFFIQLRARFSMSGTRKNRLKGIGLGITVVLSFAMLIGLWTGFLMLFFSGLKQIDMLDLGLLMPFLAGMIAVLIFGTAGILGILFQSKDISFLASLPVRAGAVFASKFFLVYLYELTIMLAFVLPAVIVYGIVAGMGVAFYIKGVAAALLLPMLPLVISTLISLILMRFSGLSKRREMFMVIGGFVLTFGYIIGQNVLMSRLSNMSQDAILALLSQANSMVELIGRSFPPALWAVHAITSVGTDSLLYWGLYLLSTVGSFAIAYFVGSKLYLSGALAQQETAKRSKKARLDAKKIRSASPLKAMAMRELRLVIRSPIYALNGLIGIFLFPAMLFILPMFQSSDPDLEAMANALSSIPPATVFVAAFGVGMFVCMTNLAAGTVLSREGSYFWLSKVIPVPYRTQAFGKLIFAWSIDAATLFLCLIVAPIMFPNFIGQILAAGVCALVVSVPLAAVCMMIDIAHPKLRWSSEAEAMKQNMNGMLGMLSTLILGAGFTGIAFLFSLFANGVVTFLLTLIVIAIAAVGSVALLGVVSDLKYKSIEP